MNELRILVTGSRDWTDVRAVESALYAALHEHMDQDLVVVHGGCPTGADQFAAQWARMTNVYDLRVRQEVHPADWSKHGRAAGPIRNKEMVEAGADLCLAFIRNNSRGASGTVEMARQAGIPVKIWRQDYPA